MSDSHCVLRSPERGDVAGFRAHTKEHNETH